MCTNGPIKFGDYVSWSNTQNSRSGIGTFVCGPCISEDKVLKFLVKVEDGFKISGKSVEAKAAILIFGVEVGSGPYQWATCVKIHDNRSVGTLINNSPTTMNTQNTDVLSFLRNSELTDDDKLLIELGLEDPTHVPTAKGIQLAQELIYREKREEVIKVAQALKAEQDKEKEDSK